MSVFFFFTPFTRIPSLFFRILAQHCPQPVRPLLRFRKRGSKISFLKHCGWLFFPLSVPRNPPRRHPCFPGSFQGGLFFLLEGLLIRGVNHWSPGTPVTTDLSFCIFLKGLPSLSIPPRELFCCLGPILTILWGRCGLH